MGPTAGAMPTQAPTNSGGGGWERWLPTIGSVAGSVGGDILGGILTVPTGGIVNPWDTSTVLSGLGAGLGQAGENLAQGKNPIQMNDLTQAGIAAGSNLAGAGVGSLLGKLGGKIADVGASQAAKTGEQAAAQDTAQQLLDKQAANDVNYAGLGKKLQQHLNFGSNQNFFDNLGVNSTNPVELNNAAKAGTFMNDMYGNALANSGQSVDTGQFANNAFDAMKQNGITDLSSSPLGKAIAQSGIPTDELSGLPARTIDATQARSLAQSINTQMRDLSGKIDAANANGQTAAATDLENQYNTLKNIHDNLYKQIDTPQVNQSIADLRVTPEQRQQLVSQYGDQVGNYVADKVDAAQTGQELRKAMAPFAQTNEATNLANSFNENVSAGTAAKNRVQAQANQILKNAGIEQGSKMSKQTLAKHLALGAGLLDEMSGTKNKLLKAAGIAAMLPDLGSALSGGEAANVGGNVLSKLGAGINVPAAAAGSMLASGAPTAPTTPLELNQGANSMLPGTQVNPAGIFASLPGMGGSPQLEAQAMQALMGMTDPYLMGQYGTQAAQEGVQAQKARTAEAALPQFVSEFNAAGGGQGRIGALLSRIGSYFGGGPASNIGGQTQQVAQQLSTATGVPVGTIEQYMPQIGQSPQVAQMNLQQLQNILTSLGGNLAPNQMSP